MPTLLNYVDHLQNRLSVYEFTKKNFKTFSLDPLKFSIEIAADGAVEDRAAKAWATKDEVIEGCATKSEVATEGKVVG